MPEAGLHRVAPDPGDVLHGEEGAGELHLRPVGNSGPHLSAVSAQSQLPDWKVPSSPAPHDTTQAGNLGELLERLRDIRNTISSDETTSDDAGADGPVASLTAVLAHLCDAAEILSRISAGQAADGDGIGWTATSEADRIVRRALIMLLDTDAIPSGLRPPPDSAA